MLLGDVLDNRAKVTVLVDNLDKAWTPNGDLQLLSDLIFGLLSASRRVAEDFERDASGRARVNLSFALFLRSDIFAAILQFAKERDKLTASQLESVIESFAQWTFLGAEVEPNRFAFLHDEQDERKISIMARRTADQTTNGVRRFRIHPAFHPFLEIKPHMAGTPGQMTMAL